MLREYLKNVNNEVKIVAVIAAVYAVSYIINLPIGCLIYRVTGIECPACGMVSAWYWFLRGDLSLAFYYHPLFIVPLLATVLYFIDLKIRKVKYLNAFYVIMAAAFIIVYLIRVFYDIDLFVPLDTHFDLLNF